MEEASDLFVGGGGSFQFVCWWRELCMKVAATDQRWVMRRESRVSLGWGCGRGVWV